ncbi:formate dehydrogenase accessory protein [Methylophilaceae bacterium]
MLTSSVVLSQASSLLSVQQWRDGELRQAKDCLAEETPVAMVYNGVSHAVMLATAQDLEDFAMGFALSEGIVEQPSELYGIEVLEQEQGIALYCSIANERFVQLKERRRTLAGKTGCGLCGAENLTQAMRYPRALKNAGEFTSASIVSALAALPSRQLLQQQTGATHASAYVLADGSINLVREDVGRHNALDKVVGALAKAGQQDKSGFVLTTSRASFEMVQKVATAGLSMLVAVSAPTALAVRVAEQCGLCLVGFARDSRFVVYSHGEKILY